MNIKFLFVNFQSFASRVFLGTTPETSLRKLEKEIEELREALDEKSKREQTLEYLQ